MVRSFFAHEDGQGLVEYALILVLIAIVVIGILTVLGGKINVPTVSGLVSMTLPKWSNTGRVLRLKGKGAPRADGVAGDEYVKLKVMLPDQPDPELEGFIAQWHRGTNGQKQATEE